MPSADPSPQDAKDTQHRPATMPEHETQYRRPTTDVPADSQSCGSTFTQQDSVNSVVNACDGEYASLTQECGHAVTFVPRVAANTDGSCPVRNPAPSLAPSQEFVDRDAALGEQQRYPVTYKADNTICGKFNPNTTC